MELRGKDAEPLTRCADWYRKHGPRPWNLAFLTADELRRRLRAGE